MINIDKIAHLENATTPMFQTLKFDLTDVGLLSITVQTYHVFIVHGI
jgi:hypothetical protein